jgi:hypothetical protein
MQQATNNVKEIITTKARNNILILLLFRNGFKNSCSYNGNKSSNCD